MPGDYPLVWWYNSPTDITYHSFNVVYVYVCSSVPTVFGNKQQHYMEMIKQMLTSCLAEQSEVKLTASQALQYWSLKKHVATLLSSLFSVARLLEGHSPVEPGSAKENVREWGSAHLVSNLSYIKDPKVVCCGLRSITRISGDSPFSQMNIYHQRRVFVTVQKIMHIPIPQSLDWGNFRFERQNFWLAQVFLQQLIIPASEWSSIGDFSINHSHPLHSNCTSGNPLLSQPSLVESHLRVG